MIFVYLILAIFSLQFAASSPIEKETPEIDSFTIDYLEKYGYLDELNHGRQDRATIEEAIERFQEFFGLPQSGLLDEETIKIMHAPRCSFPDVINESNKARFVNNSVGWNHRTISYFLKNFTSDIPQQTQETRIVQALDIWAKAGGLILKKKTTEAGTDIVSTFVPTVHGDGVPFGPTTLAHAFRPQNGDIHFNDDKEWVDDPNHATKFDLFTVAIHELGHSMGLSHTHCKNAMMYPTYHRPGFSPVNFKLHLDDLKGIEYLYVKPQGPKANYCKVNGND